MPPHIPKLALPTLLSLYSLTLFTAICSSLYSPRTSIPHAPSFPHALLLYHQTSHSTSMSSTQAPCPYSTPAPPQPSTNKCPQSALLLHTSVCSVWWRSPSLQTACYDVDRRYLLQSLVLQWQLPTLLRLLMILLCSASVASNHNNNLLLCSLSVFVAIIRILIELLLLLHLGTILLFDVDQLFLLSIWL